jgi:hypothetical protein
MGMFDRDKNFGEHFKPGDRFILTSLRYVGEIETVHKGAQKSIAGIVTRGTETPEKYSLLGEGFAEQAQRATRGEFPVVVEYVKVPTTGDREVKRLEPVNIEPRKWFEGDDGPPLALETVGSTAGSSTDDATF